ncbi:MAG: PIN domain-containing protein [Gammaproteobacteria bacterium]|nr:PIN domain-containing protein [Gammaproteobacteria bacterium]
MKKTLIDSGPLIALFDRSDDYHEVSVDFLRAYAGELVTTLASITETLYLLDFNINAQTDFLSWISNGAVTIETIKNEDLVRIRELMAKYADVPMDFADACLVRLGESLGVQEIATIDSDFDVYRLKGNRRFKNVLGN